MFFSFFPCNSNNNSQQVANSWRSGNIDGTDASTINTNGDAGENNTTGSSSSSSQKRGAERLFQYMEADGSDPEDYTR